jgi:ankyrin repeat protein
MVFIAPDRFRWVFCQLEALRHCFPPSVRHILEELPETLDETYERILRDINKANRDHAHRLLQCLAVAVRPLRVAELAEVLAVDFGTGACGGTSKLNPDWRWDDQQQAVLSTCSSLVSIVDEKGFQVVQFSHFSVKEYLMSPRLADSSANVSRFHILLEPAHTILAKACLGVLLRLDEQVREYNVDKKFPLGRYAAEHWVGHAKFEHVSSHVREAMEIFFDPDNPSFDAWFRVHRIDVALEKHLLYVFLPGPPVCGPTTPLYLAALCGFHELTEHLIMKYPQQVNARSGNYVSPLGAALGREHFDVAQLLYEHGADVDVRGLGDWTLLYAASRRGNHQIVEWLVNHGADLNLHVGLGISTPLHTAAARGWVEISHIFLQRNADKNALNGRGRTPLHMASEGGHINVAQLLLDHGVDVNSLDNDISSALHLASKQGHVDVAQVLLEHGVDANARDNNGSTALHLASEQGHTVIAQFLVEHGVDVNAQDYKRSTALHLASKQGHTDIAQLLLDHGVDVNVWDNNRFTALHLASGQGHTDIARMLFEHGVDVNAWGKNRSTALHVASESGKLEVVCLLLDHGADVEVRDFRYRTPLQVASGEQCEEITKLLSERHILDSRTTLLRRVKLGEV